MARKVIRKTVCIYPKQLEEWLEFLEEHKLRYTSLSHLIRVAVEELIERETQSIDHDVGDSVFLGVFEKALPYLKDNEVKSFQECLAKSRVYLKLLASIKDFTKYTFLNVPAKKMFDKSFAKLMVGYPRDTYWCCKHLSNKLK